MVIIGRRKSGIGKGKEKSKEEGKGKSKEKDKGKSKEKGKENCKGDGKERPRLVEERPRVAGVLFSDDPTPIAPLPEITTNETDIKLVKWELRGGFMLLEAEGPEDDIMQEENDDAKRARHRRAYVQALLPYLDTYAWTITLH